MFWPARSASGISIDAVRSERAGRYIEEQFAANGYVPGSQAYSVGGTTARNIDAQHGESIDGIMLIGAHYDSVAGCPAANDNGSGVAAVLELSRLLARHARTRPIRFAAFANEEPPFFMTDMMGSR